jgi:diaminohydroxyphosphoribosylaminopyrimidine deaminase/5-amino-6-(5-phosphoribosylamino)uracil reductase
VGCVLLDAVGVIIAVAAHQKAGQVHAEALAIQKAREAGLVSHIHTIVVTLEPCNHHGRTPPCTEAILATPAKAVVIGMPDPNSLVHGGGAARLRAAGLNVCFLDAAQQPALTQALRRLLAPFTKRVTLGLPWVTVKQAINRAGNMLPEPGHKTFTSPSSLVLAHQLRRRADAIITGSGTIIADAPEFTVRHVDEIAGKRRKLVLFDRRRRIPADYLEAAAQRGFEIIFAAELDPALRELAKQGALEVLVEAGSQLTAAVLSSPYWDEHVLITQSTTPGGEDQIEIRHNTTSAVQSAAKEKHVFGYH